MARTHFGTDGVRGIVGDTLTLELVERLGRAATLWSGRGRVFVGRDTRGSGPALEQALVEGIVDAGGVAVLGGVLPTPAIALLAQDLGVVLSASHNPPEYNGVKLFTAAGHKLADADEEAIEALLDARGSGRGSVEVAESAADGYVEHVVEHFGTDLTGLRIAVDCANGAFSGIAPAVFERLGAEVTAVANAPDGANINVGCGATDLALLQDVVRAGGYDLGVAFDGDGDRMLAVDEAGDAVDGDQIIAVLALALGVDRVAVTTMTNLGFHRLMAERGILVTTTDVGDRYVLEALRREGGVLGGEQSGHLIYLEGHVSGDGLAAALLLCGALDGRPLSEAVGVMELFAQAKENVRVRRREVPAAVAAEVERLNAALAGRGRVLVRPSGTEPFVRVLVEAEHEEEARDVCGKVAHLVRSELGEA
ncbi:Phosphomannomutase [Gaiella occulta]|uniref:Phosphomannomutase n=1 Tax=Gaiella occulta TaxID=1002870 RepID=A0A7M2YYE3_9ACTN|nr:phosphoglucosamine mutase [Gaiella occulta]RDI74497.1 Phosphomannomutase [Gaiella occulta]